MTHELFSLNGYPTKKKKKGKNKGGRIIIFKKRTKKPNQKYCDLLKEHFKRMYFLATLCFCNQFIGGI